MHNFRGLTFSTNLRKQYSGITDSAIAHQYDILKFRGVNFRGSVPIRGKRNYAARIFAAIYIPAIYTVVMSLISGVRLCTKNWSVKYRS